MLALEIELLTGRYRATAFNDRRRAEWPIHPARIYSALVAALHDGPHEATDGERRVLDRLASLPPPEVWAAEANFRPVLDHYVPVNDLAALSSVDRHLADLEDKEQQLATAATPKDRTKLEKARDKAAAKLRKLSDKSVAMDGKATEAGVSTAAQLVPGNQWEKQPRTFPVAWPHDPLVHLVWPSASLQRDELDGLNRVALRVARIGHSASLVRLRFLDGPCELGQRQRWRPADGGDLTLRVPLENQRALLEQEHERHRQVDGRVLPYRPQSYVSGDESAMHVASGPFASDGWIIYEIVPPPGERRRKMLDLSRAEDVSRAFRGALLKACDGDLPDVLSGHDPDGSAATRPHLAFVPLADVGHQWATGSILGVALIPPHDIDHQDSAALMSALARLDDPLVLRPNRHVAVHVQRRILPDPRATLREGTWTQPATRWASATAVALDRNPGRLDDRDPEVVARAVESAEAVIAKSCANIGLPEPIAVFVHKRSLFDGSPPARRFMPFPRNGSGPRRVCIHVELVFDVPVRGPLLLGAGRYFGLGLFRPIKDTHA